jgi:hypothetical protein
MLSNIMNEPPEPVEISHSLALQNELRVAIRFNTVNVPASPIDRAQRVVNDFAKFYLQRHFSWSSDFIYFSSEFDSTVLKPAWIMCDFNVGERYIQGSPLLRAAAVIKTKLGQMRPSENSCRRK